VNIAKSNSLLRYIYNKYIPLKQVNKFNTKAI
jgi:hypothetical protein